MDFQLSIVHVGVDGVVSFGVVDKVADVAGEGGFEFDNDDESDEWTAEIGRTEMVVGRELSGGGRDWNWKNLEEEGRRELVLL